LKIYGGQYFSDFKEKIKITKELEKTYNCKIKVKCKGNDKFLSYTAHVEDDRIA